jgi:parvulin-like peptidyl-prolyl isomerase
MASVYSSDPYRNVGGERPWRARDEFPPGLREAAFSLKVGEHSGVIELPDACYLMMLQEVKSAHVQEMKEVRDIIERKLRDNENARLKTLWIERLRNKTYVNTDPFLY